MLKTRAQAPIDASPHLASRFFEIEIPTELRENCKLRVAIAVVTSGTLLRGNVEFVEWCVSFVDSRLTRTMSTPSHIRAQPVRPTEFNDLSRRPAPSKIGTPLRTLALCLGSLVVMVPWPLMGILLTQPYFDKGSEAFMPFGGITLFPLMILALFGSVSEDVLLLLIMLVWLAAAVVPDVWLRRRLTSWTAIGVLLGVQSALSLAQAAMGALLILGKNV